MYCPVLASCAVSAINVESAWHLVGALMGPGPGAGRASFPDSPGGNLQWRGINKDPVKHLQGSSKASANIQ